jgi:hypothetical protein
MTQATRRPAGDLNSQEARREMAQVSHAEAHQLALGTGVSPLTLLAHPAIGGRGNGPVRAAAVQRLQQTAGNRAVQRWLAGPGGRPAFGAVHALQAVQRQDDDVSGDEQPQVAVTPVPDVSGAGDAETVVAHAVGPLNLQGKTTAKFDGGKFHTENLTTEAGSGCKGCKAANCVHVTGTRVSDYKVTTKVTLPSVPKRKGMTACEKQAIKDAIDTTLADHEQQHVQAFEEYNGTTQTPFDETMCRTAVPGFIKKQHKAEAKARAADAKADSAALDPFNFDIDFSACDTP